MTMHTAHAHALQRTNASPRIDHVCIHTHTFRLQERGVRAIITEYFLDNRVGRPDPRTFSDPRYYSDVLIEVVALAQP